MPDMARISHQQPVPAPAANARYRRHPLPRVHIRDTPCHASPENGPPDHRPRPLIRRERVVEPATVGELKLRRGSTASTRSKSTANPAGSLSPGPRPIQAVATVGHGAHAAAVDPDGGAVGTIPGPDIVPVPGIDPMPSLQGNTPARGAAPLPGTIPAGGAAAHAAVPAAAATGHDSVPARAYVARIRVLTSATVARRVLGRPAFSRP